MSEPATAMIAIQVRDAVATDDAFVYQSWLRGYKLASHYAKRIRDVRYYPRHHELIARLFARGARALVAHPEGDPDIILGYVVTEQATQPILHWVHVRASWRRLGIATRLIEAAIPDPNSAVFSHWTCWHLSPRATQRGEADGDMEDLIRKWPHMEYDPYQALSVFDPAPTRQA